MKTLKKYTSKYVCCSLLLATAACANNKTQNTKPNVIFILTDDQGWGDFGFNGNENINTPTLDSLSEISAHLTNFYVSPLSATSRAGLLTGRYHLRTGALCVTRAAENMDENEVTLAEILRDNGYSTACFGKWHNGAHFPQDPIGQGFDEFVGFTAGHLTNYFSSELLHNHTYFRSEGYITDVLTDNAIKFIEQNTQNPFLCYIPYNAPHSPYQVPDKYYDKYAHLATSPNDPTPTVYAMCENIDHNIARLLNRVQELGLSENTIVIFTTDNGPNTPRYNGELRGKKGEMWDGGFKVPGLIYWKGKITPMTIDQTLSYVDILPTILAMCDIQYSEPKGREIDGVNFTSLMNLNQNPEAERDIANRFLFTHRSPTDEHFEEHNSILFNNQYRVIRFKNNTYELYDIKEDPSQQNNLANTHKELLATLVNELNATFEEVATDYYAHLKRMTYIGAKDSPSILPAHEATIKGSVHYVTNEHGWAGDWLSAVAKGDTVGWDVYAVTAGEYKISLQYALAESEDSVTLGIQSENSKSPLTTLPNFNTTEIECADRVKRVEAYDQSWTTAPLGTIQLSEGNHRLTLNLDSIKNNSALNQLEIKGLIIQN